MLSRQCVRSASAVAQTTRSEQLTKASNGLQIVSKDNNGPISQLVLAFRAGSRYEDSHKKGLVHHLRNNVGRDVKEYPGVSLLWSAQSIGATLNGFSTRDLYGVHMSVPRDATSVALSILGHVAAAPALKPWEMQEVEPTLSDDLAYRRPFDFVFEDIHTAAFRSGSLSRSVYTSPSSIGKLNTDDYEKFASKFLVSGQGVLYGLNIEHEQLVSYGTNHAPITTGAATSAPASPYKGGEQRRETNINTAHIILAGEGASASDVKGLAIQAVLMSVLGRGPSTKYSGKPGNGLLPSAIGSFGVVQTISAVYEGSGIVGVYIVSDSKEDAGSAVHSVHRALAHVTCNNIESAKAQAKMDLLRASAHTAEAALERAAQVAVGVSDGAIIKAIEQVTAKDVEAAAKKIVSKMSITSYGAIDTVPYLSDF